MKEQNQVSAKAPGSVEALTPEAIKGLIDGLREVTETIRVVATQTTERAKIQASAQVEVARIEAVKETLLHYLDRSFDERRKNFDSLFSRLDADAKTGNVEAIATTLKAVLKLADSSPFKQLADVGDAREALEDRTKTWDFLQLPSQRARRSMDVDERRVVGVARLIPSALIPGPRQRARCEQPSIPFGPGEAAAALGVALGEAGRLDEVFSKDDKWFDATAWLARGRAGKPKAKGLVDVLARVGRGWRMAVAPGDVVVREDGGVVFDGRGVDGVDGVRLGGRGL